MSTPPRKHSDFVLALLAGGFAGALWKRVYEDLRLKSDETILDFGAGKGGHAAAMAKRLCPRGKVTGIEMDSACRDAFVRKQRRQANLALKMARIDGTFSVEAAQDRVTLFFVLHRYQHHQRILILQNAYQNLKVGGSLCLLDWNETAFDKAPKLFRYLVGRWECPQTIDFVEREWKEILRAYRFRDFRETVYLRGQVRLLQCLKS